MARPGPQTQAKRMREQKKREKREAKEKKKALRKALKESGLQDGEEIEDSQPEELG